jgi:ubiquinone/menaquinone biosynthesis C-methylase UbiE
MSFDTQAFHEFEHQGWEDSAQAYSQHLSQLTSATIPSLLDAVDAGTATRLIDLATGPGYVAAAAQKRGCDVVAVDFSENMIELAKSMHGSSIVFEVGDVEKLPQADESFDAAVMNFGILHLSEPERALAEIFRILKTGGKMAFTVWHGPDEAVGFNLIRRAIETFGNSEVSIPDGPPFFGFSDGAYTERVLTDLGFTHIASQKLSLVWVLDSPQDVFTAIYEGAARTGGLLRRQDPRALAAIKHAVVENCAPYFSDGKARIPMPCVVYSAAKPT